MCSVSVSAVFLFTILLKRPSTAEVEEVAFNSEGKHKIPKQEPDTAVREEGEGMKAGSVLDTEGCSLHTTRAARQPCRNPKKLIHLLIDAPQGATHLFLGQVQPIAKCCNWR